jgi:hypothetical protein
MPVLDGISRRIVAAPVDWERRLRGGTHDRIQDRSLGSFCLTGLARQR